MSAPVLETRIAAAGADCRANAVLHAGVVAGRGAEVKRQRHVA